MRELKNHWGFDTQDLIPADISTISEAEDHIARLAKQKLVAQYSRLHKGITIDDFTTVEHVGGGFTSTVKAVVMSSEVGIDLAGSSGKRNERRSYNAIKKDDIRHKFELIPGLDVDDRSLSSFMMRALITQSGVEGRPLPRPYSLLTGNGVTRKPIFDDTYGTWTDRFEETVVASSGRLMPDGGLALARFSPDVPLPSGSFRPAVYINPIFSGNGIIELEKLVS